MGKTDERVFEQLARDTLRWMPSLGIGFHPAVDETIYDETYLAKYQGYEGTEMAEALTQARVDLVNRWLVPALAVVDVGIGSGQFVLRCEARNRGNTYGYDINPSAKKMLKDVGLWLDPTAALVPAATFWDSLEHIPNPAFILQNVQRFVFISAPIYRDVEHVLRSKHFRPGEHCWYWTDDGMRNFMALFGFEQVEQNRMESDLGREDIGTYVFRRKE